VTQKSAMRILALLALVLALHAAELPFKPPVAYACDVAFSDGTSKGGGRFIIGGPGKQRMEMKSDEGAMTIIIRQDQKKMYMLNVAEKSAMVMPLNPAMVQVKDPTQDPGATFTKTGSETVNGVACDRYDWTSGAGKGTVWIDAKQGVQVRAKDAKSQADFTNYQIGAQKAELFEVPKGYETMEMPGMGGMMGGQ